MFRAMQPHSPFSALFTKLPFRRMYSNQAYKSRPAYVMDLKDNASLVFGGSKEHQVQSENCKPLNVTFFVNKHNSLSQRLALELAKRQHTIKVFEINDSSEMSEIARTCQADLILAPFLTKSVPEDVYANPRTPCIIVHPGIEGDRGRHSLDWALYQGQAEWGVTLLQAVEEMDAGDIWSTLNFQINRTNVNTLTKSSLYSNEVTEAAVRCAVETVDRFQKKLQPRPLDYNNLNVKGTFNPPMKKADRIIDWKSSVEDVASRVRMCDSSPGAIATLLVKDSENNKILEETYRVFGAHLERKSYNDSPKEPGQVIGQRHGAILVQCGDGAVWLSHLKKNKLKLSATSWLKNSKFIPALSEPEVQLPYGTHPSSFQEIWTWLTPEGACFVHFNFYNGAMNTDQCQRLSSVLRAVSKNKNSTVVVLMGGHNFFSNGIHLNCIENSENPSVESLHNINAINDVVRDVFSMQDKVTISALQGNAGAGGVMMALASDLVLSRDGVVLNPHYTNMSLFGSEYHTFFLEERLGKERAREMTSGAKSILSSDAVSIGLFDGVMGRNVEEFQKEVESVAQEIAIHPSLRDMIRKKSAARNMAWYESVDKCRQFEIENMVRNFQSKEYETARRNFVLH